MAHRPPERHLAAWRSLLEVHATVVELLARELEEHRGLPLGWYDVLLTLDRAPQQRLRMQELAQSVLLSKSGLTRLIDRMEAEGLVRRERCPSDRRGAFAVLTPEGRSVFRRAAPVHLRGIQEHFARHLDEDEAATLFDALARVTSAARRSARARRDGRHVTSERRSPGQARQLGRPATHARPSARAGGRPLVP